MQRGQIKRVGKCWAVGADLEHWPESGAAPFVVRQRVRFLTFSALVRTPAWDGFLPGWQIAIRMTVGCAEALWAETLGEKYVLESPSVAYRGNTRTLENQRVRAVLAAR